MRNSDIQIEVVSPAEIDAQLMVDWRALQNASQGQVSPFYNHEFMTAVSRHRPDTHIALLSSEGRCRGVLPFHKNKRRVGAPLGGQISDYQGIIGTAPDEMTKRDLLQGLGLAAYDYNHALKSQTIFAENAFWGSQSPRVDLRQGLDAWRQQIKQSTSALKNVERKRRKIAREHGELEFRFHDASASAWAQFLEWKDAALSEKGVHGFFERPWLNRVLHDIRDTNSTEFAGVFSTLYAGDQLVAAHFGMRSEKAWHWWFPTYSPAFEKYSPGLILLLFCVEAAADMRMDELDFGRGSQRYKAEFSNDCRLLCEGTLNRATSTSGAIRALRLHGQRAINQVLPTKIADFTRRGGNKVLGATLI